MRTTHLLLPFTHGIDVCALEHALRLAKGLNAKLVALSLIRVSKESQSKGARLEHVQQSKDFLEVILHQAAKYCVPVERLEVFTSDVVQSIEGVTREMECEGILLFMSGADGVLLHINEIKHLMEIGSSKLYLMRLESKKETRPPPLLLKWLANRFHRNGKQQDEILQAQPRSDSGMMQNSSEIKSRVSVRT